MIKTITVVENYTRHTVLHKELMDLMGMTVLINTQMECKW